MQFVFMDRDTYHIVQLHGFHNMSEMFLVGYVNTIICGVCSIISIQIAKILSLRPSYLVVYKERLRKQSKIKFGGFMDDIKVV